VVALLVLKVPAYALGRRLDMTEVNLGILGRSRDANERDVRVLDGLVQASGRAEAGFSQLLDPLFADVMKDDLVAELGKALAGDGSDDTATDDAYFRRLNPLQY